LDLAVSIVKMPVFIALTCRPVGIASLVRPGIGNPGYLDIPVKVKTGGRAMI